METELTPITKNYKIFFPYIKMEDFCMPNYKGGSIVNLMSSILNSFGTKGMYPELKIFPGKEIKSKNVVLLIIDGLGYEYLVKNHSESLLKAHLLGSMTSVFPPTTASAVTSFFTGVAPQQHAITGWFMNLKELGAVSCILPFTPRHSPIPFSERGIDIRSVLPQEPISNKIKAKNFVIQHEDFSDTDYSHAMSKNAKLIGFKNLRGMFKKIKRAIDSPGKRKYIYSYWGDLDIIGHEYGINNKKAARHLKEIDKELGKFARKIKGTDTTLIITADHGHIVSSAEKNINIDNHPKLKACLSMPFCGEKRSAYCYVYPSKAKQFENYVKKNLSKYFYLFKSKELIDKNLFGIFNPDKRLFDRVGDYTLIAKDNYVLSGRILGEEEKKAHMGQHAGISREEMLVPLVVINC
jgi:hypothetical protein